jgi:succinate-semialdehyde dehydrogenase / glutarate-semialdehyde dehydrogenase
MFLRNGRFIRLRVFSHGLSTRTAIHELTDKNLLKDKAYIDGRWTEAVTEKSFEVHNPANGMTLGHVPDMGTEDIQKAIHAARTAFQPWSAKTSKVRWYYIIA